MKEKAAAPVIRRRNGLVGLTAAARRLGVTPGHLSRVIRGERKPSDRLARALRRMGVEIPNGGAK